jgi:hypothetical protein
MALGRFWPTTSWHRPGPAAKSSRPAPARLTHWACLGTITTRATARWRTCWGLAGSRSRRSSSRQPPAQWWWGPVARVGRGRVYQLGIREEMQGEGALTGNGGDFTTWFRCGGALQWTAAASRRSARERWPTALLWMRGGAWERQG